MSPPRPRNTAGRYAVNALSSVLTAAISMTALVWVNQYLLRRISPEEYALVPVVTSLMVFAEFFRIIFTRGLSRFMVEADARGDDEEVARIVSSMLPVLTAVAAGLGLLGWLVIRHVEWVIAVDPAYRETAQIMLALLFLQLCASIVTTPLTAGLYVRMRFVELNLVQLGQETLRIVLMLALLFGLGPRALWVIVAGTAANLVQFAVLALYTWRILPSARFRPRLVSRATVGRLLSFSMWTSVQGINMFVQRAAAALLLNRFSSSIDVAAFYVGNLPNQQIRKLAQAAAGPATPALTALYATEGEGALQDHYFRGGRYHLWGTLFLVPPLAVHAEPLIRLYVGETYLEAAAVMVILFLLYPLQWSNAMFYQIAYAIGRIRAYNVFSIILAAAGLAAMYLFVAVLDMGAVGAALGMTLGFGAVQVGLLWPMGLKLVNGSWRRFLGQTLVPGMLPFLAACLATWLWGLAVPIAGWAAFAGACAVSAAVYLAVMLGATLDPTDKALALAALRKVTRRFRK